MNKKLFLPLTLLFALPLSSCNFDINPNDVLDNFYDVRSIVINEKNVAVDVGEEKFVEVIGENLGSGSTVKSIIYTSCDSNIATAKYGVYDDVEAEEELEGMYITGKSVGYTSIIASFKNASSSVDVNVINSNEIPYIHLFDFSLCIEKDVEYVLPSEIVYKGVTYNTFENEIYYDFSFISDQPSDVVEMSQDDENGDIIINPLKVGSTKVLVSTIFKEMETSTLLTIDVIEPGAGIIFKNEGFTHLYGNNYFANLYVADYGDYKKTIDLEYEIYKDANIIDGAKIDFTSEDPSIASVEGNKISGVKKGHTYIKGSYDGVDISIEVNVDKPIIETSLTKEIVEVDVDASLEIVDSTLLTSDVIGVYYQDIESENILSSYDSSNKKINIDKTKFHKFVDDYGENKKFYIETNEIYIDTGFTTDVYSKVIETYDDLASWGTIAQSYITEKFDFNGYFILGNNIDCGDKETPVALDRNSNFAISGIGDCVGRVGFNGVFDGRGYTINNYKPEGLGSFITWLTADGELKNIGFNNVTLDSSLIDTSAQPKAVLIANGSSEKGCNVNNVYVNYKSIYTGLGKYENRYCSTFSAMGLTNLNCTSVFVNAIDATIDGDYDILGKMSCKGVYGLGGVHINGNSDFGEDTPVPDRIFNCTGTYAHFKDAATMKENLETQSVISNWDNSYWNIVEGIPTWKTASGLTGDNK